MPQRYYRLISNYLETVISFALLAWQVAIPWLVPHFVTQDGPSHLYSATVMRGLVFHHAHSIYSPWYTIQRIPLPNWTASIALAALSATAGADRAERLFASLAILIGFFAIAYAIRSLAKDAHPWSPLANFLLQTWFLWLGFYDFYLGMALVPFAIGYYARHSRELTVRRAAALAAILLAIFATHLIPALVATMTVGSMAAVVALTTRQEIRMRQLALTLAAALPIILLAAIFALQPHDHANWDLRAMWAWHEFPMHVFVTGDAPDGVQHGLRDILLCCIIAAVFLLRPAEWKSPRGGLLPAALGAFLLYIFVPDAGLGGGIVKIRFSWAVFLLGGLAVLSASRFRWARWAIAVFAAIVLPLNFIATTRTLRGMSAVAADYLPVAQRIPDGASFVRLHYATPDAPSRFGYGNAGRDPLAHLDAFAATAAHAVDLSDYEALSRNFPLVFRKQIDPGFQSGLYAFEGPDSGTLPTLLWLNHELPKPIEFVLVVGDQTAPAAMGQRIGDMVDYLTAHGSLVATSATGWVRLYRNHSAAAPP